MIMSARSVEKLESVLELLPTHPESGAHQILPLDFAQTEVVQEKMRNLVSALGPVEILVCNAGGPKGGPLLDADFESFETSFKVHVLANQAMAQILVPGMKERGYGRIINIISTSVKAPIPNLGVSNTIRGAVANWSKTLAYELGSFGITVNNVLPGFTQTERLEDLMKSASQRLGKTPEEVEQLWLSYIPSKRFANPSETAQAVAFLAGSHAAYINGINLPVDGGRTASL